MPPAHDERWHERGEHRMADITDSTNETMGVPMTQDDAKAATKRYDAARRRVYGDMSKYPELKLLYVKGTTHNEPMVLTPETPFEDAEMRAAYERFKDDVSALATASREHSAARRAASGKSGKAQAKRKATRGKASATAKATPAKGDRTAKAGRADVTPSGDALANGTPKSDATQGKDAPTTSAKAAPAKTAKGAAPAKDAPADGTTPDVAKAVEPIAKAAAETLSIARTKTAKALAKATKAEPAQGSARQEPAPAQASPQAPSAHDEPKPSDAHGESTEGSDMTHETAQTHDAASGNGRGKKASTAPAEGKDDAKAKPDAGAMIPTTDGEGQGDAPDATEGKKPTTRKRTSRGKGTTSRQRADAKQARQEAGKDGNGKDSEAKPESKRTDGEKGQGKPNGRRAETKHRETSSDAQEATVQATQATAGDANDKQSDTPADGHVHANAKVPTSDGETMTGRHEPPAPDCVDTMPAPAQEGAMMPPAHGDEPDVKRDGDGKDDAKAADGTTPTDTGKPRRDDDATTADEPEHDDGLASSDAQTTRKPHASDADAEPAGDTVPATEPKDAQGDADGGDDTHAATTQAEVPAARPDETASDAGDDGDVRDDGSATMPDASQGGGVDRMVCDDDESQTRSFSEAPDEVIGRIGTLDGDAIHDMPVYAHRSKAQWRHDAVTGRVKVHTTTTIAKTVEAQPQDGAGLLARIGRAIRNAFGRR